MRLSVTEIVALLVCLIPTTIGGLLSAIGIAGMDRLIRSNVLAMSGRAVEAAGDVDTLLLDKTGTITTATAWPASYPRWRAYRSTDLAEAARLSSFADETPEGRSIVEFVEKHYAEICQADSAAAREFIPFTAQTRMSGCNLNGLSLRKGAVDAVSQHVRSLGGFFRMNWRSSPPRSATRAERRSRWPRRTASSGSFISKTW